MTVTDPRLETRMKLDRLKAAYTTRRVPVERIDRIAGGTEIVPRPGDLVVAEVASIGQHKRLELRDGRRAHLFVGDIVLVAYGNRYAPDQFEAVVPARLEPCELVAAGGLAGKVLSRHATIAPATGLVPLGLALDAEGHRLNVADFAAPVPRAGRPPLVVAVVGTAMNAGKTTSAAHLVRGLGAAGLRVGAAKVTGTGAGGDGWLLQDAGAEPMLDFTDAGFASTSQLEAARVESILCDLLAQLGAAKVDVAVVEVADGLLQPETAALIDRPSFRRHIDVVLFAAGDAMGAVAGSRWLRDRGVTVTALCGLVSASELASREAAQATGLDVWPLAALGDASVAARLTDAREAAARVAA